MLFFILTVAGRSSTRWVIHVFENPMKYLIVLLYFCKIVLYILINTFNILFKSEVKLKFKDRAITANMMWYEKKGNKKIETFLNYTQDTHKHSMSCQDERENGINKAFPYGKQAQVQYINLAWMNEICKRMWHNVYKENKTNGSCRRPFFWSNNENELCPNYIFPI